MNAICYLFLSRGGGIWCSGSGIGPPTFIRWVRIHPNSNPNVYGQPLPIFHTFRRLCEIFEVPFATNFSSFLVHRGPEAVWNPFLRQSFCALNLRYVEASLRCIWQAEVDKVLVKEYLHLFLERLAFHMWLGGCPFWNFRFIRFLKVLSILVFWHFILKGLKGSKGSKH